MKIKIKKLLRESLEASKLKTIMQKYNIEPGRMLGKGQYGTVYYGVSDDYGPVAIKMLDKTQLSTKREVENYDNVNKARSQSKNIKKHFPKVYHIDETDNRYSFIVMEILDVQQGYQYELISTLFGGINTVLQPYHDEKQASGTFRTRASRMYVLFKNKKSQNSIIEDMKNAFYGFDQIVIPVVKEFFASLDTYVSMSKDNRGTKQLLTFKNLSPKAKTYLYQAKSGDLKIMFEDAPWLLTFIIKQLDALEDEDETGMLFAQYHESLIRYWIEFIRKSSPIGLKDSDPSAFGPEHTGAPEEQWQAFKEAASVKQAIKDLKTYAGLQVKDLHDKNVMIRPKTGDIVIVDLGLFKKIK